MSYILIVDDDPASIKTLKILLNSEGYLIKSATNGHDALAIIASSIPELILLDITMPLMSGLEVCRQVKRNPDTRHVPVIFLTGHTDYDTKEIAFEAGAQDYITKPFHGGETLARVRNQIQIRQSFRQIQHYHERETRRLKNLIQIKNDFITSTTHDLKNPLATISLAVELIRRLGPNQWDRVIRQVNSIERASETMKKLVMDVLDLAKLEGEITKTQVVDLNVAVQSVISEIADFAQQKSIGIQFALTPIGSLVEVDPDHLNSILRNILSNAVIYSPPDSTIRVRIDTDQPDGYTRVIVQDQGPGIAQEELDKVFDRFFRGKNIQHQEYIGTGLGLHIVKSLVERNGGYVSVASELGVSSTFTVGFVTSKTQSTSRGVL